MKFETDSSNHGPLPPSLSHCKLWKCMDVRSM